MNVRGVGQAAGIEHLRGHARRSASVEQSPDDVQSTGGEDASSATDPLGAEEPKGVVRLLMEGHFRGVADVRLRTNFADQLPADMPPLSDPTGNGSAYARFLDAYNALQPAPEPAEDTTAELPPPLADEPPPPEPEADSAAA